MPKRPPPPPVKAVGPHAPIGILELDRFTDESIKKWLELSADLDELSAVLFFGLLPERRRLHEKLLASLAQPAREPLDCKAWWRTVSFQYSNEPLSCAGSMLGYGGRFTPGADLDPGTIAPWPTLYLAADLETAFREKFQIAASDRTHGLTPEELALQPIGSHSTVRVNCRLHRVFDMTTSQSLAGVASVFAKVKMPKRAQDLKKKLQARAVRMVGSTMDLWRAVLEHNWRQEPVQFGLPAPSQILAQLVRDAGYEGILYPSTKGAGMCLAVFADQLHDASYVELMDPAAASVRHTRLDPRTAPQLAGFEHLPSQARRLASAA